MKIGLFGLLVTGLATPAVANTNLGFEDGSFAGWTAAPGASITGIFGPFSPVEGVRAAVLFSGEPEVPTTLTRQFALQRGQRISGYVGFIANDHLPYDDYMYLTINNDILFRSSVSIVGDRGNSGWVRFDFHAPSTGEYRLELGVANAIDNSFGSAAFLDGVSLSAVPEPSSWALMTTGFGFAGSLMRRRRAVVA